MEIFEKSRQNKKFRNMVDDPVLNEWDMQKRRHNNFCACGLAATGDTELLDEEPGSDPEPVKNKVINLQAWTYIRTGLVLIGAFVVLKYAYTKLVKQ